MDSNAPAQPQPPSGNQPVSGGSPELWAGGALMAAVLVSLFLGGKDVYQHKAELRPLVRGDAAPAFTLPDPTSDQTVSLGQFRGKVVLVDFWATWCPPCMREIPELSALHAELAGRGFTVLGVNREPENLPAVRRFLAEKQVPFPVGVDNSGVADRYRIISLPTTVLIDRQGRVVNQFLGYTEPTRMRQAVLAALDQP